MLRGSPVPSLLAALLGGVPVASACSSSSSAATPASTCVYPAGPYGTAVGDVIDPSLSWQGYVEDGTQAATVGVKEYYDCDGTRGVTALLLDESATWCVNCVNEAHQIGPEEAAWESQGVHVVTLMAQDQQTDPATLGTALSWRNEYALTSGAVCADPQWTLKLWGGAGPSGNGFPTNILIDPRTMKIVSIQPTDLQGTVQNLAASNSALSP
jgi:hypothetical protein